jgi:putative transposase
MTEDKGLSVSRACQVARLTRAAYYKSGTNWAARDAAVIAALNAAVAESARWGFWKCFDRIHNQGHRWNHKRVYRVYCAMKLNLPRRAKRRVPQRVRQPLWVVPEMNVVWALDFMRDTLYGGRVFRTLNVIDEANRGALGIDIATSIPAVRVTAFVAQLIDLHGRPRAIQCDNGPEFLGEAFVQWSKSVGMAIQYIQPGKPNQNAYIEGFNRTLRDELLDLHLFARLDDVREAAYWWKLEYNEDRPHDSLGDLTPVEYAQTARNSSLEVSP